MRVTVKDCMAMTALYCGVPLSEMRSPSRKKASARPRMMAMALARELTAVSFPQLGKRFGGRDHSTVICACKRAAQWKGEDCREAVAMLRLPGLARAFAAIRERHIDWWLHQGPCMLISERPTIWRGVRKPIKRAPAITIKARLWEDHLGVRWNMRAHVEAQRMARVGG